MSTKYAAREVAKEVYSKYFHDSVYCHSFETIVRRVEGLWKDYKEGRKRLNGNGKESWDRGVVQKYNELVKEKDSL